MTRLSLLIAISFGALTSIGPAAQSESQSMVPSSSVTLYSSIKHRGEGRRKCVNFQGQTRSSVRGSADLCYGSLFVGSFHDWFDAVDPDRRTVVKDLGLRTWSDEVTVPILEPLAVLAPGQHRKPSIDASGRDGADGLPGANGANGANGAAGYTGLAGQAVGSEPGDIPGPSLAIPEASRPERKRNDGKPKVDAFWTKALLDHVYVVHVVDEFADFYALFRVDALEPGDNCTISWRVIAKPAAPNTMRKKRLADYGLMEWRYGNNREITN